MYGNSAIHCAASSDHLNCVSFLVNFGANIWVMDNDLHTAMDVAGIHQNTEIVKLLDNVAAKQMALSQKTTKKMREKASLEAQKRIKRYQKLQNKAQKELEKQERKLSRNSKGDGDTLSHTSNITMNSTLTKNSYSSLRQTRIKNSDNSEPKTYSALTLNSATKKRGGVPWKINRKSRKGAIGSGTDNVSLAGGFGVSEIDMDGTRTIRSLSGLKRDFHIMYVKNSEDSGKRTVKEAEDISRFDRYDAVSRAASVPDLAFLKDSSEGSNSSREEYPNGSSIFDRTGFGTISFIRKPYTSEVLHSIPAEQNGDSENHISQNGKQKSGDDRRRSGSLTDSIGTVGSLAMRMRDVPWDSDVLDLDEEDELDECTPLQLFLASNNLLEYLPLFNKEHIDLEAVLMLSDNDIKDLGLPMGPRKKLLNAIDRRKHALEFPGPMIDTAL